MTDFSVGTYKRSKAKARCLQDRIEELDQEIFQLQDEMEDVNKKLESAEQAVTDADNLWGTVNDALEAAIKERDDCNRQLAEESEGPW